jgi:antitoxin FitA
LFAKLAIRNIPEKVFKALERLAELHGRSTEGEARQAITEWVEPLLATDERSVRRKQLAERLNRLVEQFNIGGGRRLSPSQIAERIGEPIAENVENWFHGVEEPTFSQLSAVATLLGADPDWLKHGEKCIYHVEYHRLSENPFAAVDWLLQWTPPEGGTEGQVLTGLHIVRSDDPTGNLLLVKESRNHHYVTYRTPVHVSEEIGAGGEGSLAALFVTLQLLYKRYATSRLAVKSYLLRSDDLRQLTSGNTNPGALLTEGSQSCWWEDIWDGKMSSQHDYWPGWSNLCERIERVISARRSLSDWRTAIASGNVKEEK